MDTQNTTVHIKLWHREFWMLAVANLLLQMSVYILILALPPYLHQNGFSGMRVGMLMGAYGVGLFSLGSMCSYLVQRYRRNHVCQYAILGVVLCIGLLYYLEFVANVKLEFWMLLCTRFLMGAEVGLATMVLGSTLVIDVVKSSQRTSANHIMSWLSRFSLALGPLLSVIVMPRLGYSYVLILSAIFAMGAWVLISLVSFPFKAPSDKMSLFSWDRFFLPQGFPLFFNLVMLMTIMGLLLTLCHGAIYYGMMMGGLVVAVIAEQVVFANADLKSEILTGLVLLVAAILMMMSRQETAMNYISPAFVGFSMGLVGSRFLLFYIKLADHCQRGTSQSSFFLAWELGISLGLFLGYGVVDGERNLLWLSLSLLAASFLFYNYVVHPWYVSHKNR